MSSSRRTVLCVAACLVAASLPVTHAATARDGEPALHPKVVEMVQRQVLDGTYRTLVIGVVEDGQSAVFGPKGATAPDGQAVYEIGSITKTFTGLLLAQEVTQKRLRPEDPVSRLLPQARVPTFRGQAITLMDLVTQTSALPRLPTNFAPKDDANPYVDYDAAALTSFLASHRLDQRPGERHEYSNLGFGLLGMALSASAGLSYGDMVASRIAQPLG